MNLRARVLMDGSWFYTLAEHMRNRPDIAAYFQDLEFWTYVFHCNPTLPIIREHKYWNNDKLAIAFLYDIPRKKQTGMRVRCWYFEPTATKPVELFAKPKPQTPSLLPTTKLPKDPNQTHCPITGQAFDTEWCNDTESWVYTNAVLWQGKYVIRGAI